MAQGQPFKIIPVSEKSRVFQLKVQCVPKNNEYILSYGRYWCFIGFACRIIDRYIFEPQLMCKFLGLL
jgi:hypothetical protein